MPATVTARARAAAGSFGDASRLMVRWGAFHGLARGAIRKGASEGDLQSRLIVDSLRHPTSELHGLMDEIRDAGPVVKSRFSWITAQHEVVREVLTSNDFGTGFEPVADPRVARVLEWAATTKRLHPIEPPSLLVTEPPAHTRYRKLVTRVFSVRAVEQLRDRVQQVADGLLDDLDPAGPVDLVARYCALLPVTMIAEILGVPPDDRQKVLRLGSAAAASLDMGLTWRQFRNVESALVEFDTWLTGHIERLRREPGDNLLSRLVHAADEEGRLDDRELKATAGLVLAAGFETTVNLLGNGIRLLCDHPDQLTRLQREPELWPNAVDEVLRIDPPVLLTGRTAMRDTEVAGVRIPSGHMVTTVLAGANHDPAVFTDPHSFDVGRENARDHISFSSGRHYCLGAALARMEGEIGLRTLFDRHPDLRLLPGKVRRDTRILRGYAHLPARLV